MTLSVAVNVSKVNHEEACCFRKKKKLSEAGIFITIHTLAATNLENKCNRFILVKNCSETMVYSEIKIRRNVTIEY